MTIHHFTLEKTWYLDIRGAKADHKVVERGLCEIRQKAHTVPYKINCVEFMFLKQTW